jgi:hypothetical protein
MNRSEAMEETHSKFTQIRRIILLSDILIQLGASSRDLYPSTPSGKRLALENLIS